MAPRRRGLGASAALGALRGLCLLPPRHLLRIPRHRACNGRARHRPRATRSLWAHGRRARGGGRWALGATARCRAGGFMRWARRCARNEQTPMRRGRRAMGGGGKVGWRQAPHVADGQRRQVPDQHDRDDLDCAVDHDQHIDGHDHAVWDPPRPQPRPHHGQRPQPPPPTRPRRRRRRIALSHASAPMRPKLTPMHPNP